MKSRSIERPPDLKESQSFMPMPLRASSSENYASIALVMMPFLGGSQKEWAGVMDELNPRFRCIGVDMPGFGDAAEVPGYSVAQMVEYLAALLDELKLDSFVLVGHSMSGKVATAAARLNAIDPDKFRGLRGIVLVASSPPGPEPIDESKREEMIESLGKTRNRTRHDAENYIQNNVAGALSSAVLRALVDDVLRTKPAAWVAWLEHGSNEDWSERIGLLDLPALIVAAEKDVKLGPEAQRSLVLPYFRAARLEVVVHCGHLMPVDRPKELASLIEGFATDLDSRTEGKRLTDLSTALSKKYKELIDSERVSEQTRKVLLERATPDHLSYVPRVLRPQELAILRAVADRVLPQRENIIDFGARLDTLLANGTGKGWRYAELPADIVAYRGALAALNGAAIAAYSAVFTSLSGGQQDVLLGNAAIGKLETGPSNALVETIRAEHELPDAPRLTGSQMQRWFEELRAELTGIYVSHPETLSRLGYSGIADGANSQTMTGFVQLGLDEVEPWEPRAGRTRER